MEKSPSEGMKKNTNDITRAVEETMIHNIRKNFVINGRNVFRIFMDFMVMEYIVFILNTILRARRASLVFLNICSKPPVVAVVVLLRRRKSIYNLIKSDGYTHDFIDHIPVQPIEM